MAKYIMLLLVSANAVSFALYGTDKRRAKRGRWRISEKTLLLWSAAAPFGAVLGTRVFHHKTQKIKFDIILLVSCIAHILLYGTLISMMIK